MPWTSRSERRPLMGRQFNSWRWHAPAGLLFASQAFFRFGYYGVFINLFYLVSQDPYSWNPMNALIMSMLLNAFSYLTAPLGGWLSDSWMGRLNVAIIGSCLAFLGSLPLPFLYWQTWDGRHNQTQLCPLCGDTNQVNMSTVETFFSPFDPNSSQMNEENCFHLVLSCVILIGVGTSFVWAVISPLLADQYPESTMNFRHKLFYWFYFSLNLAGFLSILIVSYVQQIINMFWGYLLPSIAILMSLFCLLVAIWFDIAVFRPKGSPVSTILRVVGQAMRSWWRRKGRRNPRERNGPEEEGNDTTARRMTIFFKGKPQRSAPVDNYLTASVISESINNISFLDYAMIRFDGSFKEEEVKGVRSVIRVTLVLLCLIPYWTMYFQMVSTFLMQGLYMDLDHRYVPIPATWLCLFNVITVLVLIPLLHYVFFPYLEKHGVSLSLWSQLAIGLFFATASVVIAGVVEYFRMQVFWGFGNNSPNHPRNARKQTISNTVYYASDLSVFWQIPQYLLIGIGEVFAIVSALNIAITETPRSMHAIATAVMCLSAGLGGLFSIVLYTVTSKLLIYSKKLGINGRTACPKNHNIACGFSHLDFIFYILAGLGAFGSIVCLIVMRIILPNSSGLRQIGQKREEVSVNTSVETSS